MVQIFDVLCADIIPMFKTPKTSFYSSKHLTFLLIHVVPKMFCEMLLCFMKCCCVL